jgi:hypothetical protein
MTTLPDPMDAGYHTLRRAGAALQERASRARRFHHRMGQRSPLAIPRRYERRGLAGGGVPRLAGHGALRAESHHEP